MALSTFPPFPLSFNAGFIISTWLSTLWSLVDTPTVLLATCLDDQIEDLNSALSDKHERLIAVARVVFSLKLLGGRVQLSANQMSTFLTVRKKTKSLPRAIMPNRDRKTERSSAETMQGICSKATA